jgi:hypothetical protein
MLKNLIRVGHTQAAGRFLSPRISVVEIHLADRRLTRNLATGARGLGAATVLTTCPRRITLGGGGWTTLEQNLTCG